jgi:hypothetical protein
MRAGSGARARRPEKKGRHSQPRVASQIPTPCQVNIRTMMPSTRTWDSANTLRESLTVLRLCRLPVLAAASCWIKCTSVGHQVRGARPPAAAWQQAGPWTPPRPPSLPRSSFPASEPTAAATAPIRPYQLSALPPEGARPGAVAPVALADAHDVGRQVAHAGEVVLSQLLRGQGEPEGAWWVNAPPRSAGQGGSRRRRGMLRQPRPRGGAGA